MSWFDTAGFASLAKSALKEAQKTIDKALDINEEDEAKGKQIKGNESKEEGGESFFGSWGVQGEGVSAPPTTPTDPASRRMTSSTSLWGSFTGSFFEHPSSPHDSAKMEEEKLVSDQPKKTGVLRTMSLDLSGAGKKGKVEEINLDDGAQIREEIRSFPPVEVVFRRREPVSTRNSNNRLSVISSESDRRSSDSCDVISSTPDSELPSTPSSHAVRHSGSFESVEVITSPSSVEVIQTDSPVSPSKYSSDSISPISESCDVCPVLEEDEVSDSYTSVSETTIAMVTVLEQGSQQPSALMLRSTSSIDTSFSETLSPRDSLSRLGGRTSCDEGLSSRTEDDHTSSLHVNIEQSQSRISSTGSEGEGCPIENSSCEGTLMGSSSEANDAKETMLADAMTETTTHREHSPIGSDRSDLVKIGSSGHTSGDELETTTSSDIEIISSPNTNGDSSSTASRQSPSKIVHRAVSLSKVVTSKVKGHHREPSEASSGGSEEGSEVDRLLKKISDMTEVIEARESKLIDLSRMNAALQESNSELKSQLERHLESQEVKNMSEEFTQRMAALERKFQQAIREKEQLKKQLDQAKSVAAEREEDMEKEQLITELRSEGEKLSKQQLVLSTAVKKLRAAEKDNMKTITSLREEVAKLSQELERSKKAVSAKEEMERSHIEAVNNLTKQKALLEKELVKFKADMSSISTSLVNTQKELSEKEIAYKGLEAKKVAERSELEGKIREDVATEIEASEQQVATLQSALEDMQTQLVYTQQQHTKSESALRREIAELVVRLEAAERRAEESTEAISSATGPLTRQIRELTQSQAAQQASFSKTEHHLNQTIADLEGRLSSLSMSERSVREQYEVMSGQLATLQDRIQVLNEENSSLSKELASANLKVKHLDTHTFELLQSHDTACKKLSQELEELRRENKACQEVLSVTKAALEAEKRKLATLQEEGGKRKEGSEGSVSGRSSPTLSHGRISLSESVNSSLWPNLGEENLLFESMSSSSKIYETLTPSNNTTYLETLQAHLKLKDGELQQVQWEVGRLERERSTLSSELVELTSTVREQEARLAAYGELQTRYDALLQMYGEKMEENQELKMDLTDVKEMYKAQIEELLKKEVKSVQS